MTVPCSVIVKTKNEEQNIEKCLRSLEAFDEVFVVDSNSIDNTRELARMSDAIVVPFTWSGRYPKKCQWCLENLPFSHEWVMFVDADEIVPEDLAEEIADLLSQEPQYAGFFVTLDYVFMSRVLRHGAQAKKLVLMNRHKAHFAQMDDLEAEKMGELEGHYQPTIHGRVGHLKSRILHEDHDSLYHFFDRHNGYSDWEAITRSKPKRAGMSETQSRTRAVLKQIFSSMPGKPIAAFVYSYLFKLGFLDGRPGFDFALARFFYYWQTDLKLRELRSKHEDR